MPSPASIKKIHPHWLAGVAVLLILGLLAIVWQFSHRQSTTDPVLSQKTPTRPAHAESGLTPPRDTRTAIRSQELVRLKQRWLEIASDMDRQNGAPTAEQTALVKETAASLLCSSEALELIAYLQDHQIRTAAYLIRDEISRLFASPRAAEARALLSGVHLEPGSENEVLVQGWSLAAGRGCPVSEFESFYQSFPNERCSQEALFGRNMDLMATDPITAIRSTLQALQRPTGSASQQEGLKQQLALLPANSNFEQIDKLLPPLSESTPAIDSARSELIAKWAATDPAAAASYVMASPDRMNPDKIGAIARVVLRNNLESGFDWVQNFPEGPYFDAAASAAIPFVSSRWPEQSQQLAALIQDPKLRKAAAEYVGFSRETR
jgi:hypothetical protein